MKDELKSVEKAGSPGDDLGAGGQGDDDADSDPESARSGVERIESRAGRRRKAMRADRGTLKNMERWARPKERGGEAGSRFLRVGVGKKGRFS